MAKMKMDDLAMGIQEMDAAQQQATKGGLRKPSEGADDCGDRRGTVKGRGRAPGRFVRGKPATGVTLEQGGLAEGQPVAVGVATVDPAKLR